jgi:hypothetical protein
MKLEQFATDIVSEGNFIKASFGGFQGSGKTLTSCKFIVGCYKNLKLSQDKPLLMIDNEKGSRFLIPYFKKELPKLRVIVKQTEELADILESFRYLHNGEISFLFIDSLTKVWYQYINQYLDGFGYNGDRRKKAFMTLNDWGNVIPAWREKFSKSFVDTVGNIVFTGRGGHTYEMEEIEENGKTKKAFVQSGVKMKTEGETPYETDLNVWMEMKQEIVAGQATVWREAFILKDRSNTIDGMTFKNPDFDSFKPVIDMIFGLQTGKISKESDTTNMAPKEEYGYQENKKKKEIALEKIQNELLKLQLGTSVSDKALKVKIIERFFGTSAWTEIEGMKIERLTEKLPQIEEFVSLWAQQEDKAKFITAYQPSLLVSTYEIIPGVNDQGHE